jgi:hypothetical protein
VSVGLVVVGRNGRTGQVIIQDNRADGAAVIFVCDLVEGFHGGIAVQPESPAQPGNQQPTATGGRGKFPWLDSLPYDAAEPFELRVDTSQLNANQTFFLTGKFIDRAVQAVDEGDEVVALTEETASEWGQVNPQAQAKAATASV